MTEKVSLKKRTEDVKIVLRKKNVFTPPKLQIKLVLDHSPSAYWMYDKGIIQETINRLMGVTMVFDDDGVIDVFGFAESAVSCEPCTEANHETYVKERYLRYMTGNSTYYAPAIKMVLSKLITKSNGIVGKVTNWLFRSKEKSELPTLVFFITDGQNYDHSAAAQLLERSSNENIYWHFVGVGHASEFTNIENYAEAFDNVGLVNLASLDISDDELYDAIFDEELTTWLSNKSKEVA